MSGLSAVRLRTAPRSAASLSNAQVVLVCILVSRRAALTDTNVARSLTGANVRCMAEDASGRFFFGTMSGVVEVDPAHCNILNRKACNRI